MSKGMNKVILIGNLGKDPELKYTANGLAVANFSVAVGDQWKDAEGNKQEKTEWVNIVVWKKLAEVCGEYLKKGSRVCLEGKLQTRSYDDKNGVKRYVTEVVVNEMLMLDSAQSHTAQPEQPEPSAKVDDLPF